MVVDGTGIQKDGPRGGLGFFAGLVLILGLIAGGLEGCKSKQQAAVQGAPPPAPVTVAHPVEREVTQWDTYTGHLEAPEAAKVAARVSGLITAAPFDEGSIVKKGDLLFVIDDRPYKADLDAKLADQQKFEAQLLIANLNYNRIAPLLNKASTQQEVDEAKAQVAQGEAAVAAAKAAVETAKLNLEWCRVLSPIDGRVSNKLVTVGNLVNGGTGQVTLLTTVQSVSPMYCYVDIDENSVLKYQKLTAEGKLQSIYKGKVPCYLELADETGFPHEGYIDFADNHVDPSTGTQRVRGVLENKSGMLIPGLFARMRVPGSGQYKALLIPDIAIGNDQDQRSVLVVDKDNKVEPRRVMVGALFGNLRAIVSGLQPDDRVIINGQMHARPGAVVAPTEQQIKVDEAAFINPNSPEASNAVIGGDTVAMGSEGGAATQPAGVAR
ncbi:MAG: efflux RND transporter periplasmic adaptor subunit [Phycisphaerae bacterium]